MALPGFPVAKCPYVDDGLVHCVVCTVARNNKEFEALLQGDVC